MKLDPNAPAYPALYGQANGADGLTKREAFAMAAMQTMCSLDHDVAYEKVAEMAVKQADALIAQLNKEQT